MSRLIYSPRLTMCQFTSRNSTHLLLLELAIYYVSHDAFGQPLEEMSQLVQVVCGVHQQVKNVRRTAERNK